MARARPASPPASDRVLTLHPAGKNGVNIERDKYEEMRRAILRIVPRSSRGMLLSELADTLPHELDRAIFGPRVSITWYLVAVKQDLEARGEIEIVPEAKPQRLRRVRRSK